MVKATDFGKSDRAQALCSSGVQLDVARLWALITNIWKLKNNTLKTVKDSKGYVKISSPKTGDQKRMDLLPAYN